MSFNFMAAITICCDFGAQKIKADTVSTVRRGNEAGGGGGGGGRAERGRTEDGD